VFFRRDVPADTVEKTAELRRLLKLPAEQDKFLIVNSPARRGAFRVAASE
jgi:hypothetical protein